MVGCVPCGFFPFANGAATNPTALYRHSAPFISGRGPTLYFKQKPQSNDPPQSHCSTLAFLERNSHHGRWSSAIYKGYSTTWYNPQKASTNYSFRRAWRARVPRHPISASPPSSAAANRNLRHCRPTGIQILPSLGYELLRPWRLDGEESQPCWRPKPDLPLTNSHDMPRWTSTNYK